MVMEVSQNSQKFRLLWRGRTELKRVLGGYKNAAPVPRVLWHGEDRTHRSLWYGYQCRKELSEVPGTGMKVLQKFQKFRVLWHGRTDPTEVSDTGISVLQDFKKFWVLWQGRTELTEVPGR